MNPACQAAPQPEPENLLILASAGSGKTYRLSNRIIRLVAKGVDPAKIMALTFTRKAAGEFLDSLLGKLAAAIRDPRTAARLRSEMGLPEDTDFTKILGRVVRSLSELRLATIDSFFARVVRGFQYELGIRGGPFSLIEGPREAILREQLISDALGGAEEDPEFIEALRRASIGREEISVHRIVGEMAQDWMPLLHNDSILHWGMPGTAHDDWQRWEDDKTALALKARTELETRDLGDRRRATSLSSLIDGFESHTIGSGSLKDKVKSKLAAGLFAEFMVKGPREGLLVSLYGEFEIDPVLAASLRELVFTAAECETAAAAKRTRAIHAVIRRIARLREQHLVKRGLLGFDDIKRLMAGAAGGGKHGTSFDLRRELIEFRLDAATDHWLLDEFQDTSRNDWRGIERLIDEVLCDGGQRSLFVVGDRKQAIYGWRGGDVELFDILEGTYEGVLHTEKLSCSQRSCPQVLELVNKVCGNGHALANTLGPEVAALWKWQDHVSAERLRTPELAGFSQVEQIQGDKEEAFGRMVEILKETGAGQGASLSCGILLRSNKDVKSAADFLRNAGFEVVEDGRRQPALDHPIGVAFSALLAWLANPSNRLSREIVAMSDFEPMLFPEQTDDKIVWHQLTGEVAAGGFAAFFRRLSAGLAALSAFGKQRVADIGAALEEIDRCGTHSPREAADWLGRHETNQGSGGAALQVMTIHKAKGLDFDMVILPWISNEGIPDSGDFKIAVMHDTVTVAPPNWVRSLDRGLSEAESKWNVAQRYEELCGLYVGLTRAKRGLYVLLPQARRDPEAVNDLVNLFLAALSSPVPGQSVLWHNGDANWFQTSPAPPAAIPAIAASVLGTPVPKPTRTTPTASKNPATAPTRSASGMAFGSEVHSILESVGWTDESPATTPASKAGEAVDRLLKGVETSRFFRREGRKVELHREQAVDSFTANTINSGVIDRLHILRNEDGSVAGIEIIDYKTDAVDKAEDLRERYAPQMEAYRSCLATIHPGVPVEAFLVSVRHAQAIAV